MCLYPFSSETPPRFLWTTGGRLREARLYFPPGEGALPYLAYAGMWRWAGYDFHQKVLSLKQGIPVYYYYSSNFGCLGGTPLPKLLLSTPPPRGFSHGWTLIKASVLKLVRLKIKACHVRRNTSLIIRPRLLAALRSLPFLLSSVMEKGDSV